MSTVFDQKGQHNLNIQIVSGESLQMNSADIRKLVGKQKDENKGRIENSHTGERDEPRRIVEASGSE